jgi:hypothetical protein
MSDAFAYLSVLLSIILGLAIAEILQGYRSLLIARGSVKLYAPPLIWSATMLVLAIHFWWASFGLANRENWDFAAFSAVLMQTIMLFMGASLLLPKTRPDQEIDLKTHYYREAGPFFSFGLLFLAFGYVKDWLLDRRIQEGSLALGFFVFFTAMTLTALLVRKPRVHEIIAPVMGLVVLIFISLMFARLKGLQ